MITDGQFRFVYSVQTPFFSTNQQLYTAKQELLATISHQYSLEGNATIIDKDFQIDKFTKNFLLNKQIFVQINVWSRGMTILKDGKLIGMTRNQGKYCHVDVYDSAYEAEVLTLAAAQDYRLWQHLSLFFIFFICFWILF